MWKNAIIISLLLLPSLGYAQSVTTPVMDPQRVTLTFSEYSQLNYNLTTLESNSKKQTERIVQLENSLQIASLSMTESNKALLEARKQTDEQAKQLTKLNQLLRTQSEQLSKTNASLQIANQSLKELSNELDKQKKAERRNKILLAVAAATAVYLAAK